MDAQISKQKDVLEARNEFKVASSEIEEARDWAHTLHLNLNTLTAKASEEKREMRAQL